MAGKMKDKLADASEAVANTAKNVGDSVAKRVEGAVDVVKDKVGMGGPERGVGGIQEHMDVIASCGKKVGVVDHVEGNAIKLTKKDSPDGQHHYIPVAWVQRVDNHVHLNKNSGETEAGWKADASSCGCV